MTENIFEGAKIPNLEDEKVFEAAFKQYFKPLHAYANAMLKDGQAAEEVVQTVFLNLWERRRSLTISSSLKAFLYKCVYFDCLNQLKHQKVRRKHLEHKRQDMANDTLGDASYSLREREIQARLEQSLRGLPDKCRKVFQLSRYEDLKYHEIAKRLEISVKTVEAHMGKALKTLRVDLADFFPILCMIWLNRF